jgi:hypothetical protein
MQKIGVAGSDRSPQQTLFGALLDPMPWSLPHRRGDGAGHVPTQHIVKNRILRQLSADELKSVQPWLTLMDLRSSVVLHEPGQPIERVYFPVSGMISLLAVMQSGEAIEPGIVVPMAWSGVTPPSMDIYSGR